MKLAYKFTCHFKIDIGVSAFTYTSGLLGFFHTFPPPILVLEKRGAKIF